MCGITGFTGKEEALPFLMQGLEKLEYRGYDSAGVTLVDKNGLYTIKTKGRLKDLENLLTNQEHSQTTGIGHTRWATHGVPSNLNSHPHTNADNTISIVHNGIIENYQAIKEELQRQGYPFVSQTDSEVIVHLAIWSRPYRKRYVIWRAVLRFVWFQHNVPIKSLWPKKKAR